MLKCNINTSEEISFMQLVSTNTTADSEILKKKFTCITKSILSYYFYRHKKFFNAITVA